MGAAKQSNSFGTTELAVVIGGFSILVLGVILLIVVMATRSGSEPQVALAPALPAPTPAPTTSPEAPDPTAGMSLAEAARFRAAERARLEEEHRNGKIPKPIALSPPKPTPAPSTPVATNTPPPSPAPAVSNTTTNTPPSPYAPPPAYTPPVANAIPETPAPAQASAPPPIRTETVTAHVIRKQPEPPAQPVSSPPQASSSSSGEYYVRWRGRNHSASSFGIGACIVGTISLGYAALAQGASSGKRLGEGIFGGLAVLFGLLCLFAPHIIAR